MQLAYFSMGQRALKSSRSTLEAASSGPLFGCQICAVTIRLVYPDNYWFVKAAKPQ